MDISQDYLLFDFLQSGTYTPLTGSPVSLASILLYSTDKAQQDTQGLTVQGSMSTFGLFVGELGATVPEPNAGLTVSGIDYRIESVELTSANTRYVVSAVKALPLL